MITSTLQLPENNLYVNGNVVVINDGSGDELLLRSVLDIQPTTGDQYYLLKITDRLDILAYRFYKDSVPDASKYWWVIADANNIYNPLDLSAFINTEILIPDIMRIVNAILQ